MKSLDARLERFLWASPGVFGKLRPNATVCMCYAHNWKCDVTRDEREARIVEHVTRRFTTHLLITRKRWQLGKTLRCFASQPKENENRLVINDKNKPHRKV
jgi:hypothetical protein